MAGTPDGTRRRSPGFPIACHPTRGKIRPDHTDDIDAFAQRFRSPPLPRDWPNEGVPKIPVALLPPPDPMNMLASEPVEPENQLSNRHFFLVGLLVFLLDLAILHLLYSKGFSLGAAHIASYTAVAIVGFSLNYFFRYQRSPSNSLAIKLTRLATATLLIVFLRGSILGSLMLVDILRPEAGILIGALVSSILYSLSSKYYVFGSSNNYVDVENRNFVLFVIAYSVLLRLFSLGLPELLFEEAYYWNYAKHLDIGYLDHPPMVAWIIWIFTEAMGDNEFAVRFGAFVCWIIAAYFSYKLTLCVHARANQGILLAAIFPAFFAIGLVMTPDAPLTACWSAALYFLYQALINERRMAWAGAGVAIGLGMLSKYTIALLGPATILFILADRRSRKWLLRPEPYLAVFLAALLFAPVLIWNAEHQWISFLYQSRDRIAGHYEFSLHTFVLGTILILTPAGFLSILAIPGSRELLYGNHKDGPEKGKRSFYFFTIFALFPVSVFVILSLFKEIRFYWAIPCWLALLPYMALLLNFRSLPHEGRLAARVRSAWPVTMLALLMAYGAAFNYLGLGFPAVPYPTNSYLLGWKDLGRSIEKLVSQIEAETGERITVVGMDRNRISSGLAFYRTKAAHELSSPNDDGAAYRTSSWNLFGERGLMYELWFPRETQNGKTMLLVSKSADNLLNDNVRSHFLQMGEIEEIAFSKNGKPAGRYFYSVAKGYRSSGPAVDKP
jgi:dolichol-phosphate mannosyltransferase